MGATPFEPFAGHWAGASAYPAAVVSKGAMPTIGSFRWTPGRAVELGVAEGEDPAVGGHEPVALAVGRRGPCRRSACSG